MRRPTDKSLAAWIRELEECGRLYRFYKCDEWRELRRHVLDDAHNECEDCRAHGKYSRAVMVHHEKEVRDFPSLALSRTYRDAEGRERKNLWALCDACHERRHGRFAEGADNMSAGHRPSKLELEVPERW